MFWVVFMWSCDDSRNFLDPVIQDPGTPEQQIDDEQTNQLIGALTDRIEELEMELEDEKSEDSNQEDRTPITRVERTDDPDEDDSDENEVVVTEPDPPEGLAIGDRVISQNTISADGTVRGVRIRDTPEINPNNHRDNWLFNGATGTVIDGPVEADNFTWWKIRWDAGQGEDEIICNDNPCIGWSAEIINGSVILAESASVQLTRFRVLSQGNQWCD